MNLAAALTRLRQVRKYPIQNTIRPSQSSRIAEPNKMAVRTLVLLANRQRTPRRARKAVESLQGGLI